MLVWEGSHENELYLLMAICPQIAAWPSGNIAFVPLHNIYGGCGSIPVHALTYYYYYYNSCKTDVELSSVQHHSVHTFISVIQR